MATPKHFLDLDQVDPKTLRQILDHGKAMKKARLNGGHDKPLGGKTLAMIFEKPSTRTRVSFEVGMRELGGQTIMLGRGDTQLGRGETIADTARVLSRYVDIIMMRTTVEEKLLEMAKYATVPVINGLTDKTHPCQLMADVMTFEEHRGDIQGKAIAWSGDGNNMATSWIHAAVQFDFELRVACPPELKPPADVLAWAEKSKGQITIGHDPESIVRGAEQQVRPRQAIVRLRRLAIHHCLELLERAIGLEHRIQLDTESEPGVHGGERRGVGLAGLGAFEHRGP